MRMNGILEYSGSYDGSNLVNDCFLKIIFILCLWIFCWHKYLFMSMNVYVHHVCLLPMEARRECPVLWNRSCWFCEPPYGCWTFARTISAPSADSFLQLQGSPLLTGCVQIWPFIVKLWMWNSIPVSSGQSTCLLSSAILMWVASLSLLDK